MRSLRELEDCLNQLESLNDLELQKLQLELRRLREHIQYACTKSSPMPSEQRTSTDSSLHTEYNPRFEII